MVPKRKQASDKNIEAPSDAPRSKRKRTEATEKESAKALQPESKTAKATAATATRKATAAKPKAAAKKSASAQKAKTTTAPKAEAGNKAADAKPAAKPKPAVRTKASVAKPKAAPKKAVAAKKAGGKETPAAAAKRQRTRAPSKKAEEAAEDAAEDVAEEEKPSSSSRAVTKRKAASKPAAQPRAAAKAANPASKVASDNKAAVAPKSKAATAPKAKVAPKNAAASTSKAAASKVAGRAPSTRRSKAAAAEESKPEGLSAIEEESKPAATGARRGRAANAAPKEVVEEAAEASAAPMEGVETAAEALEKPRAKGKASAKPKAEPKAAAKRKAEPKARKAATKRKAGDAVEAAEEKPEASKEAALAEERPVKRRAVAKAKKAAEPLQAVEHPSHQKESGQVYVIGAGDCGQLGVGEDDVEALRARLSPVASGAKARLLIVQVAAGGMHSVALTAEGEVYTCGVNDEGALGRETKGAPWENSSQATGSTADSYQWAKVEMPAEHGKIIQVSAGDSHTMALTEQGFIVGWGTFRNSSGVFSFSPRERLALLPCLAHSPTAPASQAVKIVSGTDHVVALLRGGKLLSWGTGEQGQLGRVGARLPERGLKELLLAPAEISLKRTAKAAAADPIVDIAAGNYSTFALTQQGQVWAWGLNNYGQLGQEGEAPVMAPKQTKTLAGEAVAAVGPGQHHTLFLTQSGRLMSAGRPTYGRLGQKGVDTASDNPVPVPSDVHIQDCGLDNTSVASIVAGPEVSAALSADGRAWLWGFGTNSQLGNGNDDSDREVPSLLQGRALQGKRVVQVDFGGQHTLLVVIDDNAPTSTAPAAATTTAEAAPLENSQAVGMDIDAPAQAEEAPPLQNGIMTGHAEEVAEDGVVADVEPRQGDPLLQEASVAAAPLAENAEQLSTAPAGPMAPIAAAAALAAPDITPQVDALAASGAPAALTHSASGEETPQPAAAAAAGADDAVATASMAETVQPAPQANVQVGQVHGLGGPSNTDSAAYAAATAADAAAAEVAQMVDSMINMPEAEKATVAAQLIPTEQEQATGLASSAPLAAQPVSAPAASAQTSLPESSAQHPVSGHVPGYVEPASAQPYEISAAEMDIDHPEAQKGSDLDDWRKSFYALSGSKPM